MRGASSTPAGWCLPPTASLTGERPWVPVSTIHPGVPPPTIHLSARPPARPYTRRPGSTASHPRTRPLLLSITRASPPYPCKPRPSVPPLPVAPLTQVGLRAQLGAGPGDCGSRRAPAPGRGSQSVPVAGPLPGAPWSGAWGAAGRGGAWRGGAGRRACAAGRWAWRDGAWRGGAPARRAVGVVGPEAPPLPAPPLPRRSRWPHVGARRGWLGWRPGSGSRV